MTENGPYGMFVPGSKHAPNLNPDLALDYLSPVDVRDYLRGRFGNEMKELGPLIHQRTDGNPLFVVSIVEDLIRGGQLTHTDSGWAMNVSPDRLELTVPEDLLGVRGAPIDHHPASRGPPLARWSPSSSRT